MRNILTIFKKQLKDTVGNKTILIQFVLFPVLTVIMENFIKMENMPEHFFTKLFSVMFVGMAPITSVAAIISEEKEKNTLRVLLMANVRPWQYLTGVGAYVWLLCMAGAGIMATNLKKEEIPFYLGVMAAGILISIAAGGCIGLLAKSQMSATSIVMPVMIILSFTPMLAMFNDTIKKVSEVLYTRQLGNILEKMSVKGLTPSFLVPMAANTLILLALFTFLYRRKGLE